MGMQQPSTGHGARGMSLPACCPAPLGDRRTVNGAPTSSLLVDGVVMPAIECGGMDCRALSLGRDYMGVMALEGLHR